jgi:catechol 2,3-dioxygenase-like lactoylglutathione lyase family enzyme
MGRVQLALNVTDLDEAVGFYSTLFQTEPAKRRPGYANFAVADPPLKLVLFENPAEAGTLNHLGVEVSTTAEVVTATRRLAAEGLPTEVEDGVTCCHALQDKVWVAGADTRWEVYTVLADAPLSDAALAADGCCGAGSASDPQAVCCATPAASSNPDPAYPLSA